MLLHELVLRQAELRPAAPALRYGKTDLDYATLATQVRQAAQGLLAIGLHRRDRVAVYLEKRIETVVTVFGAAAAGCVFVPVNPVLKAQQVSYILQDCNVRVLVTSPERLALVAPSLADCPDLRAIVLVGNGATPDGLRLPVTTWDDLLGESRAHAAHRTIDADMVSILYTSGSTGRPKGVVLSHRNMVTGAVSVSQYLENVPDDRLLAVLPLSFDAGFSQLTTAFNAGASVVLLNHLMARDVVSAVSRERITGLTAVPPLWIQVAQEKWADTITDHLRYIANTGGRMPRATLDVLRAKLPRTRPFLMYGLTEAFRSTFLPPAEVDRRPDSIGKAIPNAEIVVVREDGTPCAPNEPGELVHRGALVSLGYWNDPEKTAERFKPAPGLPSGLVMPEIAVWSGDTVSMDDEGFLYFIGRRDEMIKTSGYRVSPTEVEETIYATKLVGEAAALGVPHPALGQAIVLVVTPRDETGVDVDRLLAECRDRLPGYMVPARIDVRTGSLPRNPNGKIDRKSLSVEFQDVFDPA